MTVCKYASANDAVWNGLDSSCSAVVGKTRFLPALDILREVQG